MYVQRVELRIADSKRSLLQEYIRLQKLENEAEAIDESSNNNNESNGNDNTAVENQTITIPDTGKRKRHE
jgi:hypothetical protein